MPISLSGSLNLSGSLTTTGTITATTLVVQTITSSISSITGSTNFGSLSSDTHTFTGSMYVTGALYVPTGSVGVGTSSPNTLLTIRGIPTTDYGSINAFDTRTAAIDQGPSIAFGGFVTGTSSGGTFGLIGARKENGTAGNEAGYISFNPNNASGVYPERMRITSAGSVGIGLTTGTGKVFAKQTTANFYDGINCYASSSDAFTGIGNTGALAVVFSSYNSTAGAYFPLAFFTSDLERMRIKAEGFLKAKGNATNYISLANSSHEMSTSQASNYNTFFVSQTGTDPYGLYIWYSGTSPNNSSNEFLACADSSQSKAYIYSNGNLANRNGTYGTISSDIRLKENIIPATSKLEDLLKLNVVNFNLIDDTNKKKQLGFIAQEFKEVFPSLVYEKDTRKYDEDGNLISGFEDSLGLNVGMEFAILVKAIQELTARVQELENK